MKTYSQFLTTLSNITATAYPFKNLGISIGTDAGIRFNWQEVEYIKKAVDEQSFNLGLPLQSCLALAIAVTEEERNNHVEDHEIESVNAFFNVKVTRELISKFHSKYI